MVVRLATRAVLPATEVLAENILAVYRQANPAHQREGAVWYQTAHTFAVGLAKRYGVSVEQAAGVIAALSPQLAWTLNERYADLICRTGDAPVLGRSKRNALAILDGANPLDVLRGPKTRAFFDNILRPDSSSVVTVDRFAHDIAVGEVFGERYRPTLERKGGYERIADAYRVAAESLGIPPLNLQAITWCAWREAYAWRRGAAA
jgi:hypothetical protein